MFKITDVCSYYCFVIGWIWALQQQKKKSFKNLTPIKFHKHVVANVCKPEFLENHAEFSENSRVKFLSFKSSKGHFLGN